MGKAKVYQIYNLILKYMTLAWSLKYGFWYSIYSVVVKYSKDWLWLGKIDNPSCEFKATHSRFFQLKSSGFIIGPQWNLTDF